MAEAYPHAAGHPTDRLVGTASAMAALRAQIHHLAAFDTVGSPHVPTVLLQGETGTGKGLVERVIHDSGPRAGGPFIEVNCAAIPETMLEAELFGFEVGAFTDAKRAKLGLFEAASGGTLFLDEIDALPVGLQGKLLTAIDTKRVRRLGAVMDQTVDVKCIAATNAVLPEAMAAGRFRADLYHRLAVVVLVLPPLRARGGDIVVLAETLLQRSTAAHGVPSKGLNAEAAAWLQDYAWPGNVRELSHVMERVTLLHLGEEIDAATLMQLCRPLSALQVSAQTAPAPPEATETHALPVEAEEIRQALAQTGGNVVQAARLLGLSRDTVRYRMQRYGISRPRIGASSSPASLRTPRPGADVSFTHPDTRPPKPMGLDHPPLVQEEVPDHYSSPLEPAWEQKPVAVLALELMWPDVPTLESIRYDPWTERVRWEQAILEKVRGFGAVLVERTTSRLVWVFGIPQVLEQLPQRAVHSALAIRHMVVDASTPDLPPCPTLRLAVHLGAVRLASLAGDWTAQVQAVGETLALPAHLLEHAEPGTIVVSPEVGRLVDGWVALEPRQWPLQTGDPALLEGYGVVGVSPGREASAGRWRPPHSSFVGRTQELMLLESLLEQVKAGRGCDLIADDFSSRLSPSLVR